MRNSTVVRKLISVVEELWRDDTHFGLCDSSALSLTQRSDNKLDIVISPVFFYIAELRDLTPKTDPVHGSVRKYIFSSASGITSSKPSVT